tara:strand:+ start:1073 stop:1234 length:162 start_codon:yes stop_codon:yes gene_type:complete
MFGVSFLLVKLLVLKNRKFQWQETSMLAILRYLKDATNEGEGFGKDKLSAMPV